MNTDLPTAVPVAPLRRGQRVHVNSHTTWLPAVVTSVARTQVGVQLDAAGQPPLTGTVPPWVVRPAAGVQLRSVRQLASGDQVVTADGAVHTVAAPAWRGRDGWWFVTFTGGRRAALPGSTVLRLVDPSPQVTVNGQPITS